MKIKACLVFSILLILLIGLTGCGGTDSVKGADYVGTWVRNELYVEGSLTHTDPATLKLTANTFESSHSICFVSGNIEVMGNQMYWTIEQTDCPNVMPGSQSTYSYSVSENTMTIISTEYGMEVKEIYVKY